MNKKGTIQLQQDVSGNIYKNLKALEYVGNNSWKCKCLLCGNYVNVPLYRLKNYKKTNCGCVKKNKKKVKENCELLPEFVYEQLRLEGNTIINEIRYKRLGEEAILNNLKEHGLNCRIDVIKERKSDEENFKYIYDTNVIITVI